jgi:DNA-binding FadR family transcriptional regulator
MFNFWFMLLLYYDMVIASLANSKVRKIFLMRKLRARGLHEHVIEEIGRRIICGEYAPGVALPSEAELCTALGVSRTALREALRVLASKGLVEPKRKLGTLVRPTEHWNFLDADILSWQLDTDDAEQVIAELYELRHLVEPVAAALAAQNARAADLKILREAYEEMRAAGDDGERIAAPDLVFHQRIIAASGNRLFSSLAHVVAAALAVNFALVRDAPRGHIHSMPAHKSVLDAIAAHDVRGARVAMQRLIKDSQRDALAVRRAGSRRRVRAKSGRAASG